MPNMHNRHSEADVPHALAPDTLLSHFDAATVADNTFVPNALVLSAMALPVTDRTEDLLTEQSVLLRTERAVVDRFWFGHFAVRAL